jgi:hypothetical protein
VNNGVSLGKTVQVNDSAKANTTGLTATGSSAKAR